MSLMFEEESGIEDIAERVSSDDAAVRRIAIMELTDVSFDPEAELLAIKALSDVDSDVRLEAARVLYEFDGNEVAQALVAALSDDDEKVRLAAAETLSENKDSSVAPVLVKALQETTDTFVMASLLRALREHRVPEMQQIALEGLNHADATVRREAVGVLAYLKAEEVVLALMDAARNDTDPEVRRVAVGSLVFSKTDKSCEVLQNALKDDNWQVREEAAFVIGKLGREECVDALVEAMDDSYWEVCVKSARSLGQLKSSKGVEVLGSALSHGMSNLRKEAAAALGEIGDKAARPYLLQAQQDVDPDVRKLVQWALQRLA